MLTDLREGAGLETEGDKIHRQVRLISNAGNVRQQRRPRLFLLAASFVTTLVCAKCCKTVLDCETDGLLITQRSGLSGRDLSCTGNLLRRQRGRTEQNTNYCDQ